MRELECETWAGSDEDLDDILSKLNNDSIVCEKQFSKVQRDNDDIFDMCETLTAAARLPTIRLGQTSHLRFLIWFLNPKLI